MDSELLARVIHQSDNAREQGLHRRRQVFDDAQIRLNFSSNDYLSLSHEPLLKQAYQDGYHRFQSGSGGSALVCGYHPIHRRLEQAFAEALGVDDAVFFSSGYAANLSLMALLGTLGAQIYADKAVHASMYDGLRLANARMTRYRHCDVADLNAKRQGDAPAVIVTEGVFSMSGQFAPLTALVDCGLDIFVDEAHAFGVVGPQGLGWVAACGLTQHEVPLRVIPLGKAFAGSGAIIAGQYAWIDALLQCARPYIYSTAPSPAQAYGLLKTLDYIREADDRRRHLSHLIDYFRSSIQHASLTWRDSTSALQQLQLGCPFRAQAVTERLLARGIYCLPMRQPTVSQRETGLRVNLNYRHQPEDIDALLSCLDNS